MAQYRVCVTWFKRDHKSQKISYTLNATSFQTALQTARSQFESSDPTRYQMAEHVHYNTEEIGV